LSASEAGNVVVYKLQSWHCRIQAANDIETAKRLAKEWSEEGD